MRLVVFGVSPWRGSLPTTISGGWGVLLRPAFIRHRILGVWFHCLAFDRSLSTTLKTRDSPDETLGGYYSGYVAFVTRKPQPREPPYAELWRLTSYGSNPFRRSVC